MTYGIEWYLIAVIIIAFAIGYWLISIIVNLVTESRRPATASNSFSNDSEQHARVLGLNGHFTADDVKTAYREMISKCHPDKLEHLGNDFKVLAEKKAREVVAAYEFFRKKLKIS